MVRLFSDRSIGSKVLAVPVALIVVMLVLGIYAFFLLSDNEAAVRELEAGALRQTATLSDFEAGIWRSSAKLNQLTSVAANETDTGKIERQAKDLLGETDAFVQGFSQTKKAAVDAGVPDWQLQAFESAFETYIKQAKGVIDMAPADSGTALLFMAGADQRFKEVEQRTQDMKMHVVEVRDATLRVLYSEMHAGRTIFAAVIGAAAMAAIVLALIICRMISRPLISLTDTVARIAEKDYGTSVPGLDRGDEIGRMAKAVDVLKTRSQEADRLSTEQVRESQVKEERAQRVSTITQEFERKVSEVVATVSGAAAELRSNAEAMLTTAEETSRQATTVAAASEQATSNVQTVASAAEELNASIAEIGRQVSRSTHISNQAVQDAAKTNISVQGLAAAAQKIGDVVRLINEIAGKTNLLALNATIEAARAGEAGKGFAVVASEVKLLATQTAKATDDIAGQVGAIRGATGEAVEAIKSISTTIGQINEIATAIAAAVEEQGAATQEIARNIQQASKGTADVTENISSVTHATAKTGKAADQVLAASGDLSAQAKQLRDEVDQFMGNLRRA